jgi:hypothetical protein
MIIGSAPKMKKPATGSGVRASSSYRILKESLAHAGSVGAYKIGKKEDVRMVPDYCKHLS